MSGELQIQKSSWGLNGSVDMCCVYLFLPFLCQIEGVPASFPFTALWDCWWRTMQGWVCETKWGCWRVSQSIPISLSWAHFKSKPGLCPISCCLRGHPKQKKTRIHPPHHSIKGICLIQCCYIIPALEDNSSNPSASLHLSWSISTICQSCLIPPHTKNSKNTKKWCSMTPTNGKLHAPRGRHPHRGPLPQPGPSSVHSMLFGFAVYCSAIIFLYMLCYYYYYTAVVIYIIFYIIS